MFHSGLLPVLQACPERIPSLADAVADLLRAKDASRRRPQYVRSLRQYLTAFARGRETVSVAELTAEHLDKWFAERNEAPATRASNLGRLSALFSFSVRRGWISTNPVLRVERITIDHAPPKIWTAAQCRAVLDASSPVIRAWVTLGLFAGLRPTEAERLDWSAVRLDGAEPCVVISAEASKVRRRRIVPLCETAWAWLSLDWRREGPVVSSHSTLRRARRETAERAGVKWSADVLRHSYASFRIGRGDFAERVAADMGNSSRILLTHYRELVSREEAAAFWALRP
jgi:integrase